MSSHLGVISREICADEDASTLNAQLRLAA